MAYTNTKLLQVQLASDRGERKATISLPSAPIAWLDVSEGEQLRLSAGKVYVPTRIRLGATKSSGELPELSLSSSLLAQLGLTAGSKVHLLRSPTGLRLGPVVGILAPRRSGLSKPYHAQTSLFRRVLAAADEIGLVAFVFDFHDIRWSNRRVRGYGFSHGRWLSRWYPLPDVVFDRATGAFPGGSIGADRARHRMKNSCGIELFNTRLGGKLRLHRLMGADPVLRPHLPKTHTVKGSGVVANVLASHSGVYLKPRNGAQGKGIIRLRRSRGGYSYTLTTSSYGRVQGKSTSVAGALARLRSKVSLSTYIVQPELDLLRLNGRICDIRVLVQRDSDGAWQVTGTAVRAGAPGSIISNLHGGGRSLRLEALLRKALGADDNTIRNMRDEIEGLALRVAEVLSKATPCLGELGVDLGVDRKGRVWIIEANSRTGRAVFRRCGMHESARLADRRPLYFAMYLAGFTTK